MRLSDLWKPAAVVLAVLAAGVYAVMVIREISVHMDAGRERRSGAEASHGSVEDETILGAVWAHRHRPYDASWCPDYSPSFLRGCAAAAGRLAERPATGQ